MDGLRKGFWDAALAGVVTCVFLSAAYGLTGTRHPQVIDVRPQTIAPMERELLAEFGWNAEARRGSAVAKVAQPVVGTSRSFWAQNLRNNRFYAVQATCRAVCRHCYIFVDDAQWGVGVQQQDVDAMSHAFGEATPGHPTEGIYEIETNAFGAPPDVDGDPRIYFLVLDIQDTFTGSGAYVAGYFSGTNEFRDLEARTRGYRSNEMEMFYLDCNPSDPKAALTHAVIAHEFQHMIHFGADPEEETWLNEGCSTFSEFAAGYPLRQPHDFSRQTDDSLVDWGGNILDYEQAGMFVTYLYEHYGGLQTIADLIADTTNGTASVDNTLHALAGSFSDAFKDWVIANYVDDSGLLDGRYGYESYDLSGDYRFRDSNVYSRQPVPMTRGTVEYTAATYIRFEQAENVAIHFSGSQRNRFLLQYIELQQGIPVEVGEILLDARNEGYGDFRGGTYDTVVLVPTILSRTFLSVSYSYSSSELDAGGVHPGISDVIPLPDATEIPLSEALQITFNRPYNPETVVLDTGTYPAGERMTSDDGKTMTIQPAAPLEPERTYAIVVKAGVRDVYGNLMVDADFVWRFTTVSERQPVELAYDTEPYDWRLYWEREGQGSGVRFTPPYTPANLSAAYFYLLCIDYGGRFLVRVLADDGNGSPDFNADLLEPPLVAAAGHTGWFGVDLEPYDVQMSGEFHVMFQYEASSWPSFGAENLPPIQGRSWDLESDSTVKTIPNFDYAIRATVTPAPLQVQEDGEAASTPERFALYQNTPNPFNSRTLVRYAIPEGGRVTIEVYDLLGQKVRTLRDDFHSPGSYTVPWSGKDENGVNIASGVYLCWMRTPAKVMTKKMVLLR